MMTGFTNDDMIKMSTAEKVKRNDRLKELFTSKPDSRTNENGGQKAVFDFLIRNG
jgi:hypothetical protein